MSKILKTISIFLLGALICTSFCACGGTEDNSSVPSGDITYKVTVKDYSGNVMSSGMIVQFMQNGEKIAMQNVDENGVAEKVLPAGDYTIVLSNTNKEKKYDYIISSELTASVTEAAVTVAEEITWEPQTLVAQGSEYDAYKVALGCTYVKLDGEKRNYFLFTPTASGNYMFNIVSADGADVQIGYYGAPHFVQENNVAEEMADNSFTISVSDSMIGTGDSGTSTFVIGIDAADAKSCVLSIERIGDAIKTIEDEPWIIYEPTAELSSYVLPEEYEIKEFDLGASTDAYNIVYNETDGFYHLDSENGPLVLVRLGEDCEYIACFATILDRSGVNKYFFDENGDFVKKETYDQCLLTYFDYMDENEGVYPLTEDLKYIIQQRGEYVGWWNPESANYLFKDMNGNNLTDINNEIAWLLMCCYIE